MIYKDDLKTGLWIAIVIVVILLIVTVFVVVKLSKYKSKALGYDNLNKEYGLCKSNLSQKQNELINLKKQTDTTISQLDTDKQNLSISLNQSDKELDFCRAELKNLKDSLKGKDNEIAKLKSDLALCRSSNRTIVNGICPVANQSKILIPYHGVEFTPREIQIIQTILLSLTSILFALSISLSFKFSNKFAVSWMIASIVTGFLEVIIESVKLGLGFWERNIITVVSFLVIFGICYYIGSKLEN